MDKPEIVKQLGEEQEKALLMLGARFHVYGIMRGEDKEQSRKRTASLCSALTIVSAKIVKLDFKAMSIASIGEIIKESVLILSELDMNGDEPKFRDPDFKPKFLLEPT